MKKLLFAAYIFNVSARHFQNIKENQAGFQCERSFIKTAIYCEGAGRIILNIFRQFKNHRQFYSTWVRPSISYSRVTKSP